MAINLKGRISRYFKTKKPLSIFFDAVFVVFVVLLLIPGTRKEVSSFIIRMTALPPSSLDEADQYMLDEQTIGWQLYDIDRNPVSFATLNKKPVFINFWATWCPPCIAELPAIQALHEDFKNEVNFVLVSNESIETVISFADEKGYRNLPLYFATFTPTDFASQSIPATFVVSREGKVVLRKKGAARWNSTKMEKLFGQLIKE